MSPEILLVLLILTGAAALFITEALRADLVALVVMVLLATTGLVTPQEAFSGFSRPAVITILAIFILTAGLERTGVTGVIGGRLLRLAGSGEARLIPLIMVAGAGLSLFMNNIAAASVLLPVVMGLARRTGVKPSRLLIPLSFATLVGGMATLLTTSNILVSSALRDRGLLPYGLLDFAPVGLPIVLAGTAYMTLLGRRWLPDRWPAGQEAERQRMQAQLPQMYGLEKDLQVLYVQPGSPLAGETIARAGWGEKLGLHLIGISRAGQVTLAPSPDQVVLPGDLVYIGGSLDKVQARASGLLPTQDPLWRGELDSEEVSLVELLIAPRSALPGRTLRQINFREKFGVSVLAIWRDGHPIREALGELPLRFGDALLVQGTREKLHLLQDEPDFLLLMEPERPPDRQRTGRAGLIMVGVLGLAAFGFLPIAEAMVLGAALMVLGGCLTMDDAYRAIEWRAIFLIAGMLPLGIAIERSGAAALLGNLLVAGVGRLGPLTLTMGLFWLSTLLVQVIGNVTTAVVLAPIAIAAAQDMGADPRAVAMAVALGTSMAFLAPVSHPVNVFVMGPGGYTFRDFARVGWPLTLLIFVVVLIFLPLFWRL